MPGICGIVCAPKAQFESPQRMLPALSLGSEGLSDWWSDSSAAFGRSKSFVVPEDSFAGLPIRLQSQSLCIVSYARLDNRRDLIKKLGLPASVPLPDASLIAKAWDRWGSSCLDHLDGAFTVLAFDLKRRKLFAARDHAGEYPLYFLQGNGFVALASMPRALFPLCKDRPRLDEQRIASWLVAGAIDRQASFFEGIRNLPAGHSLTTDGSDLSVQEYWHPSKVGKTLYKRDEDYAEAFSALMDSATEPLLRSPGGVASQLSSGLDSAAVTASAASLLARRGEPLTAYTYVPQPGYVQHAGNWVGDEGPGAALVAAHFPNIRHVKFTTESRDLLGTLHAVSEWLDQPLKNLTNWVWIVAMLQHAKANQIGTVLQGAMGNSTISFSTVEPLTRWFRQGQWIKLLNTVLQGRANGETSFKASAKLAFRGLYPAEWAYSGQAGTGSGIEYLALNPEFSKQYELPQRWRSRNLDAPWNWEDQRTQFEELDFAQMAMAGKALTGVELRDPTASRRIWEFCLSIPLDQYLAGGLSRSLVRRGMRHRLPASTLALKRSGMQGADWYLTMAPWVSEFRWMLTWIGQSPAACRVLNISELKRRADNFPSTRLQESETHDYWHIGLLQGISLGTFLRTHDPDAPPSGEWYEELKDARTSSFIQRQ